MRKGVIIFAFWCIGYPQFDTGDRVVSLVIHPPEIETGTEATIITPQIGTLYAVQLPDGELHRWVAWFEVKAVDPSYNYYQCHQVGDYVKILNDRGHHKIKKGMVVRIAKIISQTPFYDLRLDNGNYHRWLAEFEITQPM